MTYSEIKDIAKKSIITESQAIHQLSELVNDDFARSVELIYSTTGRVIFTGIGKSALIAGKIVATFNSTGTPAIFMHAADAIHGDLGIVQKDDIVVCLSKSGETPEIKVLVPLLRHSGNVLIAILGNTKSYLSKMADLVIDTTVEKEACPNNLAPTSSTTAQMVIGDALAICLLEMRGFTQSDFAKLHPGGSLGKKLYLKVSDLSVNNEKPSVSENDDLAKTILEISSKRLGATAVVENGKVTGIVTDGDLRRMLFNHKNLEGLRAVDIMSKNPKTIDSGTLVVDALDLMRKNKITQLLVVENEKYAGVIHMHDILKEGII